MPLGKPDPVTGEVVAAGRHYGGGHGTLGTVGVWTCPGCGTKNTTEFVQGCPTCGAGKPGEARPAAPAPNAAQATTPTPLQQPRSPRPAQPADRSHPKPPGDLSMRDAPPLTGSLQRGVPEGAVRVIRLIEYLIAPGKLQDGEQTLRRALVGTVGFQWGQITGTIVDELSLRQEEILKLAKLQPGVWLGGPGEVPEHLRKLFAREYEMALTRPLAPKPAAPPPPPEPPPPPPPEPEPVLPDVGITVSPEVQDLANQWADQYGYRFVHTMALALQSVAEELRGNMEPRKFLDPEQVLEFAQALMNTIPDEWEGDPEEENEGDQDTQDDSVRTRQNG